VAVNTQRNEAISEAIYGALRAAPRDRTIAIWLSQQLRNHLLAAVAKCGKCGKIGGLRR
jgi:hypothetical protein